MGALLEAVGDYDVPFLAAMGESIWNEHYTPIIGKAQVDYMIEKYQSEAAVRRQIAEEGYEYFFIMHEGIRAGYVGVQENDGLYLSKLYVLREFRGLGIGGRVLISLMRLCRERGVSRIWLTVNRNNVNSARAYESWGMKMIREQKVDIGGGFFMDDFVYEIEV